MGYYDDYDVGAWDQSFAPSAVEPAYAVLQRGHFLDYVNKIYRGGVEAVDMLGRGAEVYGAESLGSALRYGADVAKGTEFYKPDIQSYIGKDSTFKQYTGEALEAITTSIVAPTGAAVIGTATTGSPFVGGAAALATVGTMFHGGSYSHGLEEATKIGLDPEAAASYANEYAMWELLPEIVGDVALLIPFVGGTAKVGIKGIAKGLKSGKFTVGDVVEGMSNRIGTKALAHKWLGATSIGGGTEVITELGQNLARENAGMAKAETDLWHTAIIGMMAQGAPAAIGTAYSIQNVERTTAGLKAGLNSEVPEVRQATVENIYNVVAKADKGQADLFKEYAYQEEKLGRKIELTANFDKILEDVGGIRAEAEIRNEEETKYAGYQPNVPSSLLDDETPNEVLKEEIDSAVDANVAEKVAERDVKAEITGTLAQREAIRREALGVVEEPLMGLPTEEEVARQELRDYEPKLPSTRLTAAEQMPTPGEITQEPQTALDRYTEYWKATPEIRALYGRKDVDTIMEITTEEVVKILPKEKTKDIAQLLSVADEGTKQSIVESTQAVTTAKEEVLIAPTVADKVKAISTVKKAQKDLTTILEYSREEVGTYVSPEVEAKEVVTEKYDELKTYDKDLKVTGWSKRTYPSGIEIHKEGKDKYIVRKAGEQGVTYKSIKKATEAAESGVIEGRPADVVGKKTITEKRAEEKRKRDVGVEEKVSTEQWLKDNDYMESYQDADGNIAWRTKEEVAIPVARLLQAGTELTKENLDKAIEAEVKQEAKLTEYERSKGRVMPSVGEIGEGPSILDVLEDEGLTQAELEDITEKKALEPTDIRKMVEKPKVLRFEKSKEGVYTSEWADSNYRLITRKEGDAFVIDLREGMKLVDTFPSIQEAAASVGAIIKGEEGIAPVAPVVEEEPVVEPRKPTTIIRRPKAERAEEYEGISLTLETRERGTEVDARGLLDELLERDMSKESYFILSHILNKLDPKLIDELTIETGVDIEDAPADYNSDGHVIRLRADYTDQNLLHEVVHAVSSRMIYLNPEYAKKIENLYNQFLAARTETGHQYGLTNTHEFLAEALSNPAFQEELKAIPSKENPKISLFDKFKTWIVDIFSTKLGERSMLMDAIDAVLQDNLGMIERRESDSFHIRRAQRGRTNLNRSDWVQVERAEAVDARLNQVKEIMKVGGNRATKFIEESLQGAADLLESISPKAARYLRDFEFDVNTKTKARLAIVENWIDDAKGKIEDVGRYKYLLLNLNSTKARAEFDKINKELGIDYTEVDNLLTSLRDEGVQRGMLGKVKEAGLYFPKKVKDLDGLMDYLGDGVIAKEMSKMLKERGLEYNPENLARVYAESLANGSYPAMLGKPSAARQRTIHKVDEGMAKFYMDPFDTLRIHIAEMTENLEQRKLLGRSGIASLEKRLRTEKNTKKIKEIQEQIEQAKEVSEDNIATWLADEVLTKGLDREKQRQVKDIFMARFNPKGLGRGLGFIKNVTVANALANFGSTITQLADLPVSIHKFGFKNVMKALRTQKLYSQTDIDFSGHLKELEDMSGWSSRLVEKTLRLTGFQQLDAFFKGVGLQASLEKAKGMSKEDFIAKYERTYDHPGEAGVLHDKIMKGEKDADVGRFVFNELSKVQPLSTSEMPMAYLKGGNARILYALKSYTLKQLNYIAKEIKQTKERDGALAAAKVASSYLILMTMANMGTDCIKSFLNGKQCEGLEESAIDNMLQMVSLSTYTLREMKEDPITGLLDSLFMPPTDLVKLPMEDLMNFFSGEDETFKTLKIVPGVGRQAWYHMTEEGQAKQVESYDVTSLDKQTILNQVKANALNDMDMYAGGVSKMVEEYNA